jgi:hypothetical protein
MKIRALSVVAGFLALQACSQGSDAIELTKLSQAESGFEVALPVTMTAGANASASGVASPWSVPLEMPNDLPEPSPEKREVETTNSMMDALKQCLRGRNRQLGPQDPNKMPPYNLGYGYICDAYRQMIYDRCMATTMSGKSICLEQANAAREQCKKNPCDEAYNRCMRDRCKRGDNSWDCYDRQDGELVFGYWVWDEGKQEFVFVKVDGQEVPVDTWQRVCVDQKLRCEQGLKNPSIPSSPIDADFVSAACYGHNCHHAADEVCRCLEESSREIDPRIVVLDNGRATCPLPGDIYHSMITIADPKDPSRRCVVESQSTFKAATIDPSCCYKTMTEFEGLSKTCKVLKSGPFKRPMNAKNPTVYSCKEFLEKRGTCEAEVPEWYDVSEGVEDAPFME